MTERRPEKRCVSQPRKQRRPLTALLESRIQSAIDGGPEDCYDGELIRELAIMEAADEEDVRRDGRAEMQRCVMRFSAKFKRDFSASRFKNLIGAEAARLKSEAHRARQEEKQSRGEDWKDYLVMKPSKDGDGTVAPCEESAIIYFTNHDAWKGALAWDEFTAEHSVVRPLPIGVTPGQVLEDHHDTLIQAWLQRETREPKWALDTVRRAVDVVAKASSFHPIKRYLEGLEPWDGRQRLSTWLEKYCGAGPAESDDSREARNLSNFISAIGERWWISAIARIYAPGCKVDHVLVLEGLKGIGKTTLVDVIFGGKFAMITGDVASKDNQMLLSAGVWGILMDELDVLGKSEMRAVKSWVTAQVERFRPTWGHRHVSRPRKCVFIATVNGDDWAMEEDRRWWPVACKGRFDLDGLRENRDQLMAEAFHRYNEGQRWYLDPNEDDRLIETAKKEQASRVPESANEASYMRMAIVAASESSTYPNTCGIDEILTKLNVPVGDQRDRLSAKVGKCLRKHGWVRTRPRDPGTGQQVTRYVRPVEGLGFREEG